MQAICLGDWLSKRRLKSPDTVAFYFGEQVITYREFADTADRIAAYLEDLRVEAGDRVAYLGDNSPGLLHG